MLELNTNNQQIRLRSPLKTPDNFSKSRWPAFLSFSLAPKLKQNHNLIITAIHICDNYYALSYNFFFPNLIAIYTPCKKGCDT